MSHIYLASPYTCTQYLEPADNRKVEYERYMKALHATAYGIRKGFPIFSPIVHCHELATRFGFATDAGAWTTYNTHMLRGASLLAILTLDGWDESKGVAQELALAATLGIPVRHYDKFFEEVL